MLPERDRGMIRKKVAIVVNSLYGGGMERVAAQLSIMLSDAGYDIYIIVSSYDKRKAYKHKAKIITLPFIWGAWQSVRREFELMLYNAYLLRRCKKTNKFDITISFAPEMNMINMISGTKDRKILTVHSCLSVRNDFQGLYYMRSLYKIYNYAYKVIAVSKWCRGDLIRNYGINRNKVQVIYNPAENGSGQCVPISKQNLVLVVGRLQDIKQQWHIIRAFKRVLEVVPDARLIIAGQGENAKYLHKLCEDMEIGNSVDFKGFVNDMDQLYQQAKCVVFSSASEAFPCSVIEAVSNGTPVVAADCPGGIREILVGNTECSSKIEAATVVRAGVLTPRLSGIKYAAKEPLTKAEYELAKGIALLLEDEAERIKIADNCITISKAFNEDTVSNEWRKLLGAVGGRAYESTGGFWNASRGNQDVSFGDRTKEKK